MQSPFSINESIGFGWKTLKAHSGLVFKAVLTLLALQVAYAIVNKVLVGTALGFVAAVVLYVASYVCEVGFVFISLKLVEGKHATYSDIVPSFQLLINYFAASLLVAAIVLVPAIVTLLVGVIAVTFLSVIGICVAVVLTLAMLIYLIYIILRYAVVGYAVLNGAGITESLRKSAHVTQGIKWHLLGFLVVLLLLNCVGALALLVGLLVTVPVTILAMAHVYTKLRNR